MIYARPGAEFHANLEGAATGLVGTVGVRIENEDGSNHTPRTTSGITELEAGSGIYSATLVAPNVRGEFVVIWDTGGVTPVFASEELTVAYNPPTTIDETEPVGDLADTRVLIPRIRRALQGPAGSAVNSPGNTLSDDEVNAIAADAIADVILYSGGADVFGHSLEVVARDPYYMAPIAWRTDSAMSEWEVSVITAQGALTYFTHTLKTMKTHEVIQDEGQTWEYEVGASIIVAQIKSLREDRDKALEVLLSENVVTESYTNFLAERDAYTDILIEPWVAGGPWAAQGHRGGLEGDVRFGWGH